MLIKALLWDIGGVLVDDPKVNEFWDHIPQTEELRADFGMRKITIEEFISRGAKLLGVKETKFLSNYKKLYWTGERNTEVINIFKSAKVDNYIYSDTNPIHLEYLHDIASDIFEKAVFSCTDKRKKFTQSYKELLDEIGLQPEDVIFIDNKRKYIDLAKEQGLNTILYADAQQLKQELSCYNFPDE